MNSLQSFMPKFSVGGAFAPAMVVDGRLTLLHPDGRLRQRPFGHRPSDDEAASLGDRIISTTSEEGRPLLAKLMAMKATYEEHEARTAEFNRFNAHKESPKVAPFQEGELLMVLRKTETGEVCRFAGWVVKATNPHNRPTPEYGDIPAIYMAYPQMNIIHEATKGKPLCFVQLPVPVGLPTRVAYGLVEGSRKEAKLAEDAPFPTVKVQKVLVPTHWLRRLTAHERATISAPQVAPDVVVP